MYPHLLFDNNVSRGGEVCLQWGQKWQTYLGRFNNFSSPSAESRENIKTSCQQEAKRLERHPDRTLTAKKHKMAKIPFLSCGRNWKIARAFTATFSLAHMSSYILVLSSRISRCSIF